jgi:hypothetical protein
LFRIGRLRFDNNAVLICTCIDNERGLVTHFERRRAALAVREVIGRRCLTCGRQGINLFFRGSGTAQLVSSR